MAWVPAAKEPPAPMAALAGGAEPVEAADRAVVPVVAALAVREVPAVSAAVLADLEAGSAVAAAVEVLAAACAEDGAARVDGAMPHPSGTGGELRVRAITPIWVSSWTIPLWMPARSHWPASILPNRRQRIFV